MAGVYDWQQKYRWLENIAMRRVDLFIYGNTFVVHLFKVKAFAWVTTGSDIDVPFQSMNHRGYCKI